MKKRTWEKAIKKSAFIFSPYLEESYNLTLESEKEGTITLCVHFPHSDNRLSTLHPLTVKISELREAINKVEESWS